jgi:hypothetical protein
MQHSQDHESEELYEKEHSGKKVDQAALIGDVAIAQIYLAADWFRVGIEFGDIRMCSGTTRRKQ